MATSLILYDLLQCACVRVCVCVKGSRTKTVLYFGEGLGGSWTCWVQSWGPGMGMLTVCVCLCVCVCVSRGMPLFAEWRAQRQQRLSKHMSVCQVCVWERERAREIKCVFGTVREQEGKCVMSSDGKRFRGALCVCVRVCVCVCSPHAMTFYNQWGLSYPLRVSMVGGQTAMKEVCLSLHTCDLHTPAHTADYAQVVFVCA